MTVYYMVEIHSTEIGKFHFMDSCIQFSLMVHALQQEQYHLATNAVKQTLYHRLSPPINKNKRPRKSIKLIIHNR